MAKKYTKLKCVMARKIAHWEKMRRIVPERTCINTSIDLLSIQQVRGMLLDYITVYITKFKVYFLKMNFSAPVDTPGQLSIC